MKSSSSVTIEVLDEEGVPLVNQESEYKTPEEGGETFISLSHLNSLNSHLNAIKNAEAMLESKITSSFIRFNISTHWWIYNSAFVLFELISIIATLILSDDKNNKTYGPMEAILTLGFFIHTMSYITYKSVIYADRKNGCFWDVYQTARPLLEIEASTIQNTLATIKEYKGSAISTKTTGAEMRIASKALADEKKRISSKIKYVEFMKHSLFKSFNIEIPKVIQENILEFAIGDDDYHSKNARLTFGSPTAGSGVK